MSDVRCELPDFECAFPDGAAISLKRESELAMREFAEGWNFELLRFIQVRDGAGA